MMMRGSAADLEAHDTILLGADETTIETRDTEAQETVHQSIEIAEETRVRRGKTLQHKSVGRARGRCHLKKLLFSPTKTPRARLSAKWQRNKSQILLQQVC